MSHTASKIYIDTTTNPDTGVSIADVQAVLNLAIDGIGDIGGLITYGAINAWAKYKPVRSATLGLTGKTSGSSYWRGLDYKCGFVIPGPAEAFGAPDSVNDSFAKSLYNGQLDWTYARPTGGISSSPFRLLDFDGYDHLAECPIGDIAATTVYLQLQDGIYHLQIDYDYNTPDDPIPANRLWLTLDEISVDGDTTKLKDWYLGVLLRNSSRWMALTSLTTLGNDGYSLTCEFPAAYAGQYEIVPFLSRNIITLTSSGVANGAYISFYNKHRETIIIKLGSVTIVAEATWYSWTEISWTITIDNDDGSTKSFTNPHVVVQRTDSPDSPVGGTNIGQANLPGFSVQGNTVATLSSDTLGKITANERRDSSKTYWVKFTCDQQGYESDWNQFEEV